MGMTSTKQVLKHLEAHGLLLLADANLPSLVALVVGEPVRGSWWGHPKGNAIYNLASGVEDHADVLTLKLVTGKVTFVHARLWGDLLALVTPPKPWQTKGLGQDAKRLWQAVEKQGPLRLDLVPPTLASRLDDAKAAATLLVARLLVLSESVHTESGKHATQLRSWEAWATDKNVSAATDALGASARFEALVRGWQPAGTKARRLLPWSIAR